MYLSAPGSTPPTFFVNERLITASLKVSFSECKRINFLPFKHIEFSHTKGHMNAFYTITKVRRPENQVLSGGVKSAFYFLITELIVQ